MCCLSVPSELLAFALEQHLQCVYRHDITNKTSPSPLQRATHFTYMGERRKLLLSLSLAFLRRGICAARFTAAMKRAVERLSVLQILLSRLNLHYGEIGRASVIKRPANPLSRKRLTDCYVKLFLCNHEILKCILN